MVKSNIKKCKIEGSFFILSLLGAVSPRFFLINLSTKDHLEERMF
jgi:hypothetical protein